MAILQSAAGFTKVRLRGIQFCENPGSHVYKCLICNCEYTIAEMSAGHK